MRPCCHPKNKLQLLQALSYAAMVHKWGSEDLIENIQKDCNPDPEELIDLIRGSELNPHIKVALIAEAFDPEVVITSDWLKDSHGIDISASAISLH